MQIAFKEEFQTDKNSIKKLNNRYKGLKEKIDLINSNGISSSYNHLKEITNEVLALNNMDMLKVPLENLIASYIHMTVNRSFRSNQRLYELVLYDFLYKIKKSKFARYGRL